MIIQPRDIRHWHEPSKFPHQARLNAHGKPRRRTWSAEVTWKKSDGTTGKTTLTAKWLSKLLEMLVEHERHTLDLRRNPKQIKSSDLPYKQLWLFCEPELERSLQNTIGRYCKKKSSIRMRMLPAKL